jgi:hypothetical protein
MADSWLHWQRESAGQTDHGVTGVRVLAVFGAVALAGILWLGPSAKSERTATTRAPSPCAEFRQLQRQGVTHGPAYWWAKGGCPSRHMTSP